MNSCPISAMSLSWIRRSKLADTWFFCRRSTLMACTATCHADKMLPKMALVDPAIRRAAAADLCAFSCSARSASSRRRCFSSRVPCAHSCNTEAVSASWEAPMELNIRSFRRSTSRARRHTVNTTRSPTPVCSDASWARATTATCSRRRRITACRSNNFCCTAAFHPQKVSIKADIELSAISVMVALVFNCRSFDAARASAHALNA
mmetsp:Transcript_64428/g.185143  ORF Transcript_64428/g.185143 Transcript_64428/m.185143 type:complete len:206 (-) Transcript_64428:1188-1805(-)